MSTKEELAFNFGVKLAQDDFDPSDLALPGAALAGGTLGSVLGANHKRIGEHLSNDIDVQRLTQLLGGLKNRGAAFAQKHPGVTGGLAGAAGGLGVAGSVFGAKKLIDMLQEREQMKGQLGAMRSMGSPYGHGG